MVPPRTETLFFLVDEISKLLVSTWLHAKGDKEEEPTHMLAKINNNTRMYGEIKRNIKVYIEMQKTPALRSEI